MDGCKLREANLSGAEMDGTSLVAATLRMPLIPIIEKGRQPASLLRDFEELDYFLGPPIEFDTITALLEAIPQRAIATAQGWLERRRSRLASLDS